MAVPVSHVKRVEAEDKGKVEAAPAAAASVLHAKRFDPEDVKGDWVMGGLHCEL